MSVQAPTLAVAVCARAGTPILEACLAALAAEGVVQPLVVTAAPGHGLAQARNEALARCHGEVLALLEADTVVAPGWLTALRTAWEEVGDEVACIGGAVRVRFDGDRPRWFSDALLGALGVPPELADGDVDAERRTFVGANVSFRADALRGVGGFWPARGHADARDWFTEEHHAQRALSRAGWRAHFAANVVVERVIADGVSPSTVLRRRARTGARAVLVGDAPSPATALRTALKAAAGTGVALASRRPDLAAERGARAAESAGRLAGSALAHREMQPVASSTPFVASVPPAAPGPLSARGRIRLPRRGGGPLVLMYHRVSDPGRGAPGLAVAPERFAEQLAALVARRVPVAMQTIVAGDAPANAVAVTFDDGYADNLTAALPALERAGVPATVFVTTGHVAAGLGFWWDEVTDLLARDRRGRLRLQIGGERRAWNPASPRQRSYVAERVHAWLQPQVPEDLDCALRELRRWAGIEPDGAGPPASERPLTVAELQRLAASPLIEIGAHTRTHPSLAHADPERRRAELAGSRTDLAAWTGQPPAGVAYPFGVPGADVDASVLESAREAGFGYGVVNVPGTIHRGVPRLAIPRRAVPDLDGAAFAAWLSG